jgi:hypothetical protein
MLAQSAAGVLMAALSACSSPTTDDETQLIDYGYDPEIPEPVTPEPPARGGKVPPAASVPTEWLPPVGRQTMPNCYVWASVYGLATFCAAERHLTKLRVKPRAGEEVGTQRVRHSAGRCEGSGEVDRGTC